MAFFLLSESLLDSDEQHGLVAFELTKLKLTDFIFLHLPSYGHGKGIHESNTLRNFKGSDLVPAEFADVLWVAYLAIFQANPGANYFARFRIRQANYLHFCDFRVGRWRNQAIALTTKSAGDVLFALSREEPRAVTFTPVAGWVQVGGDFASEA